MASAKAKRILGRLEQIKQRASDLNAQQKTKSSAATAADLAEEAAGLGLELADLLKGEK